MDLNLISATLSDEDAQVVREAFATINTKLPFLSTMQSTEVSGVFKVGNNYQPFLELAKEVVDTHPEILPAVFNAAEFDKDYTLYKTLQPLSLQAEEISEGLKKSVMAVGGDTINAAFEVYTAVKQHKDKVPGLSVFYEAMSVFFKRNRGKTSETKK